MLMRNTQDRFGFVAIFLHWLMAIVLIGLVILGLYMTRIPISLDKLKLFGWHKEWGILALMLVIVRLAWRLLNTTPTLNELPWWEKIGARAAHWAFYFFMLAIPISGWLMTSAAGLPASFFGWFVLPDLVTPSEQNRILFAVTHKWLAYGLIATFCVHVAAALKHYVINKDEILQRMLWP
ncbi:cytochrome B [Gammaproteobacteria bacterium SCGC AG-212-F23]|nr:cytochrome B [Gammaproteobacteria bacterium SCGC AG-212-F23]